MYPISQFSKLTRLSPRMLRHYDKIGLLKPQSIDSINNYRYYSDSQVETAIEIIKLKKYNFSLEEIKDILSNDDLFFKKMVKDKIDLISESMRVKTDILEEMEMYLKEGIENIHGSNTYNLLYGTIQKQYVIKTRRSISIDKMDSVIDELYDYALKNNLFPVNIPAVNFLGKEYNDKKLDVEIFIPIRAKLNNKESISKIIKDNNNIEIHKMPSHRAVSTLHFGNYDEIGLAYQAIEKWVKDSNFTSTGFTYEVYLRGLESIVSEKDFVTQIYYEII